MILPACRSVPLGQDFKKDSEYSSRSDETVPRERKLAAKFQHNAETTTVNLFLDVYTGKRAMVQSKHGIRSFR